MLLIIEKRRFVHNRIVYFHEWVKTRHKISGIEKLFGNNLLDYYKLVSSNQYPETLFNRNDINRCSNFRIKKLHKNARKKISIDLINKGYIKLINNKNHPKNYSKAIRKLSEMADAWYKIYNYQMKKNPGHGPILEKILELHPQTLCIELPVWTTTQQSLIDESLSIGPFSCMCNELLTGHIDLLMYDPKDYSLIVADYKPENNLLRSLAQVATYGLIIKNILNLNKLKCVSFSKEKAWVYDPEIIRKVIPQYLLKYGNPNLKWRSILPSL